MRDRIFGYFIIMLLIAVLSIPIVIFVRQQMVPVKIVTIEFSDVNTVAFLSKQDPVRVKGVVIGSVSNVDIRTRNALVTIEINKPLQLYKDYQITAFLKGLMGERFVSIIPGTDYQSPVPLDKLLYGKFVAGPSEVVAYVSKLLDVLRDLNKLVVRMRDGDSTSKSFVRQFKDISNKADTLSESVNKAVISIEKALNMNSDTIQAVLASAINLSDTLTYELPIFISKVQKTIATTNNFLVKIDSFTSKTDSVIEIIGNPDNIIWKDDLAKLQKDLDSVRVILDDLREDGLKIPLRITF